jgi:SAM-dependent methyltransferase
MFRKFFFDLYQAAEATNKQNISELVKDRPYATLCDLGCDDGRWTIELAKHSRSQRVFGLEIVPERAQMARGLGVDATVADLSAAFPYGDQCFDLVHANQVIEHVSDVDHFLAETKRVLRVGGAAVISTENGSSWHNIFAATMGWQIFSLTNVSSLASGVGNPMALHRGDQQPMSSWKHKTIFNYRGLIEIIGIHGLTVVSAMGAGYHPFPAALGRIDPRHSHFITVKALRAA